MPDLPETDMRDEVLLQRTLAATPETVWQPGPSPSTSLRGTGRAVPR